MQSLVAPLVSAAECNRPAGARRVLACGAWAGLHRAPGIEREQPHAMTAPVMHPAASAAQRGGWCTARTSAACWCMSTPSGMRSAIRAFCLWLGTCGNLLGCCFLHILDWLHIIWLSHKMRLCLDATVLAGLTNDHMIDTSEACVRACAYTCQAATAGNSPPLHLGMPCPLSWRVKTRRYT